MGPFPQCVVHGRHSINIWFTEEGHHIRCLFIEEYFSLYYLHKHLPLYHFFYSSYFHCEMERIGWKLKSQCYKGLIWRFYFQEDRIDILFPILPSKYNSKLWALYIKQRLEDLKVPRRRQTSRDHETQGTTQWWVSWVLLPHVSQTWSWRSWQPRNTNKQRHKTQEMPALSVQRARKGTEYQNRKVLNNKYYTLVK